MELNVNSNMLVVILILTLMIVIHVMDNYIYLYRPVLFEFINLLVFNHLIGVNDNRIGFNYDENEPVKIEKCEYEFGDLFNGYDYLSIPAPPSQIIFDFINSGAGLRKYFVFECEFDVLVWENDIIDVKYFIF